MISFFYLFHVVLFLELLYTSYVDFSRRIVSNWWVLIHLFYLALMVILGERDLSWQHFKLPFYFFAVTFVLYFKGWMGAGDVKYTSSFLWLFPVEDQSDFLIILTGTTSIIAASLLLMRYHALLKEAVKSLFYRLIPDLSSMKNHKTPFIPILFLGWFIWLMKKIFLPSLLF